MKRTYLFLPVPLAWSLWVAGSACFFWSVGATPARAAGPHMRQAAQAVETLVQVGKYRLNFQVIEGGSPAILLEAGGGMDSREWNSIAAELSHKTGATIVSYDRAGFGKSDLPETPQDMREEVGWLWQGLQKLDLHKDLVLVGHSYGGWMIRLFASEHPEAIRGMAFVDPFTNEFVDMMGVEYLDNHPMAGKIPFDTSQPEKLTKLQRALVRMVGDGLGPKMEIMRRTSLPSGIPVIVITAGQPFLPKAEEQDAWRQAHEQLTASIKGATLIVAEKSGHMIPASQPDLIIEAVMNLIAGGADAPADDTRSFRVPEGDGRPVLIDGLFSPGEWEDAGKIDIDQAVVLYLKKYRGHVFIGVKITPFRTSVVDLFISPEGKTIHHLHASAQIGERVVNEHSGLWEAPPFIYGYSVDWYANEIRWDNNKVQELTTKGMDGGRAQEMSYFKYDGYEFQVRQSKFPGDRWLLRVLVPMAPDFDKPVLYPGGTEMTSTNGWLSLDLR